MPNIICEELVYKDGKVDIVEQEASKFWNEKIQRLEAENKQLKDQLNFIFPSKDEQNVIAKYQVQRTNLLRENKKLKEENEKLNHMWAKKRDEDGDSYRIIINELKAENKKMRSACLKSVSKLSKKSKELQKEIEELEMRLDATRQVNMCYAKAVSQAPVERKVQEVLKGLVVSPDAARELDALIPDQKDEEEEEVDTCCECNKKRECLSDLFVTIDETGTGEYYVMCGMCSLNHFTSKSAR